MNGYEEKTAVFGMLDGETRKVRAQIVPNVKRETLQRAILDRVGFGATVYSDGWSGYDGLDAKGFIHETVNHAEEYIRGQVHTQAIENFWSLLKRGLNGTYVAAKPYHMDRYLDEGYVPGQSPDWTYRFDPLRTGARSGRKPSPYLQGVDGQGGRVSLSPVL
jgi:transposase-like protein